MSARKANLGARLARILIVDDHPAVREGLAQAIAQTSDLVLCGEASDTATALDLLATAAPDVAVVDVAQRNSGGLELLKAVVKSDSGTRVLVWSSHSHPLYAESALRVGAMGFVTKGHPPAAIITAIRRVLEGETYLCDDMAKALRHGGSANEKHAATETLSAREIEVLHLVGQGNNTRQIAAGLSISPKTVTTYRDRLKEKLNLRNNTELVMWAVLWAAENS